MNIDEPGEEHIIDEDFYCEVNKNLFYDLVADDILDHGINQNNSNTEGSR